MMKQWMKGLCALALGAMVVGGSLVTFTATAQAADKPTFGTSGNKNYRYDVRRGMYERPEGAQHHVRMGKYQQRQ